MDDGARVTAVCGILDRCRIPLYGFTPFENLAGKLLPCSKAGLLPPDARTVMVGAFPYYSGPHKGNLSKYAMPKDYHGIVMGMLAAAAEALGREFPGFVFAPFCDASPIPEVLASLYAGLGVLGKNGLLITRDYGSFVFIGEIVTNLPLPAEAAAILPCAQCGNCMKHCPSGVLGSRPPEDGFRRGRCLSGITQKKGPISPDEADLIRRGKSIWGCDICQDICPMNFGIQTTPISDFVNGLKTGISAEELKSDHFETDNKDRAFLWKGKGILERNLEITEGKGSPP